MNAFEAYKLFIGLKNHFTVDTYDFIKYHGEVNASVAAFKRRSDCYRFEKLSRHKDPFSYLLANFVSGSISWIGDIGSEETEDVYLAWLRRKESLSYTFRNDLTNLKDPFDSNIKVQPGEYPYLLTLYRRGKICIETLVIIDALCNVFAYWDKHIDDAVIYPSLRQKVQKYAAFFEIDKERYKKIVLEVFEQKKVA